jgi:cytochrome P450
MTAASFDLGLLDPARTVDVDLMGGDVLAGWREHAAEWAQRPPFYVVNFGFPQVVTGRWTDVREVLLDRDRFTAVTPAGHPFGLFDIFKGMPQLNAMDGPSHDRLRRLMQPFFSPEGIARFESQVETIVGELLDAAEAQGGELDAMADVAEPLVERMLLEVLIEVPEDHRREFTAYSRAMPLSLQPTPAGEYNPAFVQQFDRTTSLIEELIEDRRRSPREDLVTALVTAFDDGFPVSHEEVVGNILAVYAGAQLATATSIGVLLMNLAAHPDQYELLRQDRELIPAAIEESLRIHPAGLFGFPRYALVDTEVGETPIWKGMAVQIGIAPANLDPGRFPDPLRFDIRRESSGAIPFSVGAHQCIGFRIARMLLGAAARETVERYEDLRLAHPEFEPVYGGVLGELKPETVPLVATRG